MDKNLGLTEVKVLWVGSPIQTWVAFAPVLAAAVQELGRVLRAQHTEEEHAEACRQFNDPNSEVQTLIASMAIASSGHDLHLDCNVGVFISQAWNFNTHNQAMGRLTRHGQKREVAWDFVKPVGSYYDYMEISYMEK